MRPGWGVFPAGSVLQSIGSPGGSSTRLPSISKLPTLPTWVTAGRVTPISTANTTSPVHLKALFVVTACVRIVPPHHYFKPRGHSSGGLDARTEPSRNWCGGQLGDFVRLPQSFRQRRLFGDEPRMKRRGPLAPVSNRRAHYDESSDGITVARVTAVWAH